MLQRYAMLYLKQVLAILAITANAALTQKEQEPLKVKKEPILMWVRWANSTGKMKQRLKLFFLHGLKITLSWR